MFCVKFGWNWPSGSDEEDENVKSLRTNGQTNRWTTSDQKSSVELKNRHIVLHLSVSWAVDQTMLVQWMPLESRWALLTFRSHGQRSRSNYFSLKNVCSISLDAFAGKFLNLVQWIPLVSWWPLLIFRSKCRSLYKCCPFNICWPLCLKITKLSTVDAPKEGMFPIDVQVTRSKVNVGLNPKCCRLDIL